ncbi:hypothetical protein DBV15_11012 [Temnothorax longispinosus]|uniref:phospholipase A1 n=1 Tax=Temnothorax longispinosus TaxID=300112 RepID=A0A4S2KP85_9HYME|nr:hypothetical protein DBV15_11012 [Temnothorax longispinosus]
MRKRVPLIGQFVATMINFLVKHGMDSSHTVLVGHSLGSHIVGIAARNADSDISYVVGLDPALPGFSRAGPGSRISVGDAKYVEIIHTNGGRLGFLTAIGDVDYYPNGGKRQPGCRVDPAGACSHDLAFKYFAESINSEVLPDDIFTSLDYELFQDKVMYVYDDNENLVKLTLDDTGNDEDGDDGNIASRVSFFLYNKDNVNDPKPLYVNDEAALKNSNFDPAKPTRFITHGWTDSGKSPVCILIRDAYLGHKDYNMCIRDSPNGGERQHGCRVDPGGACSHARSYKFFAESINSEVGFHGKSCTSFHRFIKGLCKDSHASIMGGHKPLFSAHGTYYLNTNPSSPFASGPPEAIFLISKPPIRETEAASMENEPGSGGHPSKSIAPVHRIAEEMN